MIQKALCLTLLVLCWSACKQDALQSDPGNTSPYFSIHYTADSLASDSLVAGLRNVYLFTSYAIDQQDVVTCRGAFAGVQCLFDTCASSLRLEFRNNQLGQMVPAETVFYLGEHPFKSNEPTTGPAVYRTTLRADTSLGYTAFHWLLEDQYPAQGSTSTFDFSSHVDSVRVELQASRNSGPLSRVRRRVSLVGSDTAFPKLDLLITPQANNYRLEAISLGAPITALTWSNDTILPIFDQDSLQPTYLVMALDAAGNANNAASARLQGVPSSLGAVARTANFTYTTTLVHLPSDTLQLGTMALQWTDAQGQVWRSDQGPQEPSAAFQVLDTQPYELNEQGQKTWQMEVVFTCQLYHLNGQRITFSGRGRVAVAYP